MKPITEDHIESFVIEQLQSLCWDYINCKAETRSSVQEKFNLKKETQRCRCVGPGILSQVLFLVTNLSFLLNKCQVKNVQS